MVLEITAMIVMGAWDCPDWFLGNFLGLMDVFYILIEVLVTWVYTFFKIY